MRVKILILGGTAPTQLILQVLYCLGKTNKFTLHVICHNDSYSVKFSRWVSAFWRISLEPSPELMDRIISICKQNSIPFILPVNINMFHLLICHKKKISEAGIKTIRLPTKEIYELANNKKKICYFLRENNLPHPHTICVDDDLISHLERVNFPLIIKPSFGGGGHGIKFCEDKETFLQYTKTFNQEINPLILQEFVPGYNLGVSVYCVDGKILQYTIQKELIQKDKYDFTPSKIIQFIDDSTLFDVVQKLMMNLNWQGVAHIDIRYNEKTGEYFILEINPRFWGSLLGSYHIGVNFPVICCDDILTGEINDKKKHTGYYCTLSGYVSLVKRRIKDNRYMMDVKLTDSPFFDYLKDPLARFLQFLKI